ncbi:hypothetical protein BDW74DRAFT_39093 [Aspergillus multicolor]|uniref:uncharacterized protein n=1 Tax=Aspergillus multicolor TaxID=41759 RepID=UPI003CCD7BFA
MSLNVLNSSGNNCLSRQFQLSHLDLETARPSAATSALELPTLASHIRFLGKRQFVTTAIMKPNLTNLVLVGTEAEVLHGLSGVLGSTEEEGVGSGRGAKSELVQSKSLTTGLLNTGSGSRSEAQGGHRKLGNSEETVVIGNGADDDDGLALVRLGHVGSDAGKRHRGAVDAGHEKAAQHNLVEVRLRAA